MQNEVWRCLGEKLRTARSAKGLKQQDVAHRLRISQSWYQKVESGKVKVPPDMLKALCLLLNIDEKKCLQKISKQDALVRATRSRSAGELKSIHSLVQMTTAEKDVIFLMRREILKKKSEVLELKRQLNGFVAHELAVEAG